MAQSAQQKRLAYVSDNKLVQNVSTNIACCGLRTESSHDINPNIETNMKGDNGQNRQTKIA